MRRRWKKKVANSRMQDKTSNRKLAVKKQIFTFSFLIKKKKQNFALSKFTAQQQITQKQFS